MRIGVGTGGARGHGPPSFFRGGARCTSGPPTSTESNNG